MNENINMQIIRYFASKYPNLAEFIYRKLNLQEISFSEKPTDEQIQKAANCIKNFNQEVLKQFHQLSKSERDSKSFYKEILSQVLAIIME